MKRRILFVALASLSAWAACSFPSIEFAGSTTEGSEGGGDSSLADGAPVGANEDVDPTGKDQDATIPPEGGQRVDAAGGCCDCDGDEFKADAGAEAGACVMPTGDCDDGNRFLNPDSGYVATSEWATTWQPVYDWNCDKTVTKQYPYGLGKCADQLKLSGCSKFQGGFQNNPACGETDTYTITCANDGNVTNTKCTETTEPRTQGCK